MPRLIVTSALAAFLLSIPLLSTAQPEDTPPVDPKARIAELKEKSSRSYENDEFVAFYVANMKLHEMQPFVPEYMQNIVLACAQLDRRTNAYHFMLKMQQQGLSYDFNQIEGTENIRGSEAYGYMNKLMIEAGQPAGEGEIAFSLAGDPVDFSAIEWDAGRDSFLVGTRAEGKVLAVTPDGEESVLLKAGPDNGMWSVQGLAVDSERNRLWVSSSATSDFGGSAPANKRHGALFEFDLESMEIIASYSLPANMPDHDLGQITLTDDGTVYVIDRTNPIIYQKRPGGRHLEAFVTSPQLVELTDITATPDNSRVFASDAVMGIFVVDPEAQQASFLRGPETLNLGGISGIEYVDGQLIVVQSGISPQRLMRLTLDSTGAEVAEVSPMAIALEQFNAPGITTIHENQVYYFANTRASDDAENATVMQTPVEAGTEIVPPDVREFQERIKQNTQETKQ